MEKALQLHCLHTPLLIASITASTLLSGFLTTFSYVTIPGLLSIPYLPEDALLSVWKQHYYRGFRLSPPLSVFSSFCCFLNAYLASRHLHHFHLQSSIPTRLVLAGLFMFGIVPYTGLFVAPGNRLMMKRWKELVDENGNMKRNKEWEERKEERKEKEIKMELESRERLRRWGKLNYGRFVLPLVGAFVAWTTAW